MATKKSTGGTNHNKDVIYIDIDDEITAIIDKLRSSEQKIVALVLPKRAAVFQSIINMKLLKRGADEVKKHVVLITSEAGLLPLAGSAGLHVAKSLNSKPEIPDAPELDDAEAAAVETTDDEDLGEDEQPIDKSKSIGELSGNPDLDDTIELEAEDEADDEPMADDEETGKGAGRKPKFKIPDFNKFRLILILGIVGIILLGVGGYAAAVVMPHATVTIKTERTSVTVDNTLTLKTGADVKLEAEKAIIPAQSQEVKKTLTQDAPATGQINKGEKATGSVKLSLTDCSKDQITVPAGTGVSTGGKTFITKTSATLQSVKVGSNCKNSDFPSFSTKTVDVTAQTGGSQYNVAPSTFTVAGYSTITAQSSAAMTGGTDNVIKVVSQSDIDNAKQKLGEQDTAAVQTELQTALEGRSLYAMPATFQTGNTETKLSAEANAQAETVTVTQTITYTMLGVIQQDLEKVLEVEANKEIDTKRQSILDYGLDKAVITLQVMNPDGASLTLHAEVVAGVELDTDAIKKQVAGKKAGGAKDAISGNPGVTDVSVEYSPFWVSAIPKNVTKISVVIEESKSD